MPNTYLKCNDSFIGLFFVCQHCKFHFVIHVLEQLFAGLGNLINFVLLTSRFLYFSGICPAIRLTITMIAMTKAVIPTLYEPFLDSDDLNKFLIFCISRSS